MTALYSQVDRLTERRSPRTPFKSGYVCVCVYSMYGGAGISCRKAWEV